MGQGDGLPAGLIHSCRGLAGLAVPGANLAFRTQAGDMRGSRNIVEEADHCPPVYNHRTLGWPTYSGQSIIYWRYYVGSQSKFSVEGCAIVAAFHVAVNQNNFTQLILNRIAHSLQLPVIWSFMCGPCHHLVINFASISWCFY